MGCVQSLSFASIAFAGKLNAVSVLFFRLLYVLYAAFTKNPWTLQGQQDVFKGTDHNRLAYMII